MVSVSISRSTTARQAEVTPIVRAHIASALSTKLKLVALGITSVLPSRLVLPGWTTNRVTRAQKTPAMVKAIAAMTIDILIYPLHQRCSGFFFLLFSDANFFERALKFFLDADSAGFPRDLDEALGLRRIVGRRLGLARHGDW
jgi:hypothetical protein